MRLAWIAALACALAGCLLPDRSKLDVDAGIEDAGPDAPWPDDDAGDAGDAGDTGMPDACIPNEVRERSCDNDVDDDCDGIRDCNDEDCRRNLACCDQTGTPLASTFGTPLPPDWTSLPLGVEPPIVATDADYLRQLGSIDTPRALRFDSCLPIDLGMQLRAVLSAPNPITCTERSTCPYVAVVLTPTEDMPLGGSLEDELSVRLYGDRRLEVRRAGRVIAERAQPFGTFPVEIRIELAPALDERGDAWVYANVHATQQGSAAWTAFAPDPRALIPRDDLLGASFGCEEARGLYLAAEGKGTAVRLYSIERESRTCANPSHFQTAQRSELDASDVDADPSWSSGGIGEPALLSYFSFPGGADPGTESWALLYDATNEPRYNERDATLRFSIGMSSSVAAGGLGGWSAGDGPVVGNDPPQCTGAGCPPAVSVREPSVFVPLVEANRQLTEANPLAVMVYARELPDTAGQRYGIAGRHLALRAQASVNDEQWLFTSDGDCTSLRDPALLPAGPAETGRLWMLYGCERDGVLREIRMAELVVSPTSLVARNPETALTASSLGSIASISLRAADGAAWFLDDQRVVYRLWAAVRDRGGRTAIAYAEANGRIGERPVFVPYAANPVLRAEDELFGGCPEGPLACTIDSVGVARIANQSHRVRLMVARTRRSASEVRHVLVPLDQVWPRQME